ncbi:hypothetical protein K1719_014011 [Acacia pycnantha]|nr:hypothetical protein K1719_014011 [Acacia pycnantha]
MKAQLGNKTKDREIRCPRVEKASTSIDSPVMAESDKMKAPKSNVQFKVKTCTGKVRSDPNIPRLNVEDVHTLHID